MAQSAGHAECGQGLIAKESVAPWRRSSAGWMPEKTGRLSVEVASSDNAQSIITNTVNEASMHAALCPVLHQDRSALDKMVKFYHQS